MTKDRITISIQDAIERQKFVLAAYDDGPSKIAFAQYLAQQAGKDARHWDDVQEFLGKVGNMPDKLKKYVITLRM